MASKTLFSNMSMAQLWDLKAELEFVSLTDVIEQIGKQQTNRTAKAICEEMGVDLFFFLDERFSGNHIQQVAKAITAFLKHNRTHNDLTLFDLKGYDVNFSFLDPPTLHISQLEKALKTVFEHPDKLADFRYIGFRREELEQVLNLELLSEENQQMLAELNKRLAIEPTQQPQQEQANGELEKLQKEINLLHKIIALLVYELSQWKSYLIHGNKTSKRQLAILFAQSKVNAIFGTYKGESVLRKALDKIGLLPPPKAETH